MSSALVPTSYEWAQDQAKIAKLARLLRQGVSDADCAVILGTTTEAIVVVSQENPTVRQALIDCLDRTRHDVKTRAVRKAESVLQTMEDIMGDEEAAARDRIAAGKVILDMGGVTGANSAASEKRMARELEQQDNADTRSQETLNKLINHFIDARRAEMAGNG